MKRVISSIGLGIVLIFGWALAGCLHPTGSPSTPGAQSGEPTQPAQPPDGSETAAAQVDHPTVTPPAGPGGNATQPFLPLSVSAPDCSYGGILKSIQALDANTVQFSLCRPQVGFLTKIAFPTFGILPAEWIEKNEGGGIGSPLLEKPVGTGAYQLAEWRKGEQLIFKAFEGYWGAEKATTPHLVFQWHLDPAQRLLELQTDMAQGIDAPSQQDYSLIETDANLALYFRPALSVAYLGMNNTYPPFDNQLVRQAIALALDRHAIVEDSFPPGYQAAQFFTPCAIPNGCVGTPWYEYDPQEASRLLAAAGFPDGFETTLSYRNLVRGYLPRADLVAKQIQSQLAANLKIKADIAAIDSQEFLDAADAGLLPGLFLLGWGADYPDVSNFLDTHFGVEATRFLGAQYSDIVEPLKQGVALLDEAARQPYYEAANNAIRQHIPVVPLAHGGWILPDTISAAFNKAVQQVSISPFGYDAFAGISMPGQETLVWVQSAEPLSLYCADETDVDSFRACAQVIETLYRFRPGSAQVEPALAESCTPSSDLLVWTCNLRQGVSFHDGSLLDANDVVTSWAVQWDAAHPYHKGRTGDFLYFYVLWGTFLNQSIP
jgi:ABC-type transport system substrate-binding protein